MSCAACSARVQKAVSGIPGVLECNVNLLTNSMVVVGDVQSEAIIEAVKKAGYEAIDDSVKTKKNVTADDGTKNIRQRLIASLVFLALLMYISMGHVMWGFPIFGLLQENYMALGILQLILTSVVIVINQRFFVSGFRAVLNKAPNMDTLVSLGSGAAFIYSLYALFKMTEDMSHIWLHEMYFESAAMILTLITVGKMLEARAKGKTTNAIESLLAIKPKTAVLLKGDREITVSVETVKKGDIFLVRSGESIPVDGIITEGTCTVDESALTGESIPVDKCEGDNVCAGTINRLGFIICEAVKVGEDTTISQIIKMVEESSAAKAPIAKVADKVSGVFVPIVLVIALVTVIGWLISGADIGFSLGRGICVLVISCPCALGLATPVAIMVGNGVGAKNGILFKTAAALEETGRAKIVCLDKTGTITKGEPQVTDIICINGNKDEFLSYAYSLEIKSEHPLAKAVVKYCSENKVLGHNTTDFEVIAGGGVKANISGESVVGGNLRFVLNYSEITHDIKSYLDRLSKEGKTPLLFLKSGKILGIIAVSDTIKEDSKEAVKSLKDMGLYVVMITGDNEKTALAIAAEVGVDEVISDVLPDGKERAIKELSEKGKVVMVGDGINDAPALTTADIGIAIGRGTDIAIDAADVVLMKNSLMDVCKSIILSKKALKNIYENLFWAFIYNIIGIPLAAGILIPINGWGINPMFAAAAMSLSSFCVVTNALRLNFVKLNKVKRRKTMKITLNIKGMMCEHCEARVKKCLEAINGVESANVSHKTGVAVVTACDTVTYDILKNVVTEQGYEVIE